jgi:hypothetical protein
MWIEFWIALGVSAGGTFIFSFPILLWMNRR